MKLSVRRRSEDLCGVVVPLCVEELFVGGVPKRPSMRR